MTISPPCQEEHTGSSQVKWPSLILGNIFMLIRSTGILEAEDLLEN